MNSVHDLGGMHGFGSVEREANEPPFHEPWEGRTYAILNSRRCDRPLQCRRGPPRN